jgi:hypothetical protein
MNKTPIYLLLVGLIFTFQSCKKDPLKKYEGDFSFTTKVTDHSGTMMVLKDTVIRSTGAVTEIDKSTLRIDYGTTILKDLRNDFFMLGTVDVNVGDDGNLSQANSNIGYEISVTGKFAGTDSLIMTVVVSSMQYGWLTTNVVKGIRNQ